MTASRNFKTQVALALVEFCQAPRVTVAISVFSVLLVSYLVRLALQWHRLSHVPGPFWASISKGWMVRESWKLRQPMRIKEVTDKYGVLARIGPNELVTADPEVLRKMMAVRSTYTRGPWYHAMRFEPGRDNLFSMRDEVAHMKLRNKMAAGYSGKENTSMEHTVDARVSQLVDLIEEKYISTGDSLHPLDFAQKAQYFTLDVISALAFGHAFGYLERDEDVYDYIKITNTYLPIMMTVANAPSVANLLHSRLLRGFLPKESDKLGFGAFIGVAKSIVAQRFEPSAASQPDMLGSFIRHGLTQDEVSSEVLLQVVAGSDTSVSVIRVVMLNILTNPGLYVRLRAEIDTAITQGQVSAPITDTEARQLTYLQAAIKEGLRIMPPATGLMFREVPPGGDIIDGKFIPGGTQIGSASMAIHHSKRIFGADAELFRPERWFDASEKRVAEMTSTVDLVFHYGKYQCLGKSVALMEFNKIFVELLRRFDFSIVHPDKAAHIENSGIWAMRDFWVRVSRREMND